MRLLGFVACFSLFFAGCDYEKKVDYFEGLLIYETDDVMLNNVPVDSGKFIKYYVKGDSVRVESFTSMGKQVHLRDYKSQTGVLIFVFAGKKVALLQDFSKDTLQRGFQIEQSSDSKKIAELYSEKVTISGGHLESPIEVYYSPNYPKHIIDIYDGIIPGLPTKYQLIVQQIAVNYSLVRIEHKTLDNNKFSIPDDCFVMTIEEFMEFMSQQDLVQ